MELLITLFFFFLCLLISRSQRCSKYFSVKVDKQKKLKMSLLAKKRLYNFSH